MLEKKTNKKTIILSHYPPYGILDKVKGKQVRKGKHAGLHFLTYIIKKYNPFLFVCGHIHEGKGIVVFGKTYVINAGMGGKEYTLVRIKQDKKPAYHTRQILFQAHNKES